MPTRTIDRWIYRLKTTDNKRISEATMDALSLATSIAIHDRTMR